MKMHCNADPGIGKRELEAGYVTYATLRQYIGGCVLMNAVGGRYETLEYVSGYDVDDDGEYVEIFQWYAVNDSAEETLKDAGEIVYYDTELETYFWAITHWGTSWDYVFTDIEVYKGETL